MRNYSIVDPGWRQWSTKKRCRVLGIFIGVSTATWFALVGQFIVFEENRLPSDVAVLGLFWLFFIVRPAAAIADAIGWNWESHYLLGVNEFCAVLLVNAILWGTGGAFIGHVTGMCLTFLKRNSSQ